MLPFLTRPRAIITGANASGPWTQSAIGTLPSTYSIRDGAALLSLPSGRLLLIGGWNPYPYGDPNPYAQVQDWGGLGVTNEIWSSDDAGATWSLLHAHDSAPVDRFAPGHTTGALRVGANVVMIGGDYGGTNGEVWTSTDEGETWTLTGTSAPTTGRVLGIFGVLGSAIYSMGGQTAFADPGTASNEVWRSTDGGASWVQLADAPWAPRGMVYNAVSHRGYLYLVGGGAYADLPGDRTYLNDVWRFDGTTWAEVLANGHTQWLGRQYHNVISTGSRLWVMCGYGQTGVPSIDNLDTIAYSDDGGATWTAADAAAWGSSHADAACFDGQRIVRAMGNGNFNPPYPRTVYEIAR